MLPKAKPSAARREPVGLSHTRHGVAAAPLPNDQLGQVPSWVSSKLLHQIHPRRDLQEILDLHERVPFEIIHDRNAAAQSRKSSFRANAMKGGAKSLPTLVNILKANDSPSAVPPSASGFLQHPRTASRSVLRHESEPSPGRSSPPRTQAPPPEEPSRRQAPQRPSSPPRLAMLQSSAPQIRRKTSKFLHFDARTGQTSHKAAPSESTSSPDDLDANDSPSDILPSPRAPPRIRILWQPSDAFTRHYFPERSGERSDAQGTPTALAVGTLRCFASCAASPPLAFPPHSQLPDALA